MLNVTRLVILPLAIYTLFAQPGLPACWLMRESCEAHPHPFQDAHQPHTHDYLFETAASSGLPTLPSLLPPVEEVLAALIAGLITLCLSSEIITQKPWSPVRLFPPPKFFPQ